MSKPIPATPVRPFQGRSLSCHIPAGGASRATQRLAFVGQLRRPSSSVRVLRSCVSTHPTQGGHVGPPLHRVDTLGNIHIPISCRGRPMCLPCARPFAHPTSFRYRFQALIWTPASRHIRAHGRAYGCSCVVFQAFVGRILMSDIGNSITDIEKTTSDLENSMSDIGNGLYLHFHIGKQDGETVPQEITAVWREMRHLRQSTPKDDDPEGGRTVPNPVPDSCSTSSRSFPLSPHPRRWRIPRHTAVSVCWTASPSVCIRVCPLSICIYLSYTGRTLRSAATTCWGRGEKINPVRIGGGRG